jgi:hypothetical protein
MIRKLKMGMVGGGRDAFIGGVHRMAARLDAQLHRLSDGKGSSRAGAKRRVRHHSRSLLMDKRKIDI